MDDFHLNTIQESRAEWCEQFILLVRPCIIEGFDDIFMDACRLCKERQQQDKYLITFQNMICQIPKWSQAIVEKETKRIIDKSHCSYLEVLLTATHIAQLKILSAIRAGQKTKKIDVDIPVLADYLHNIYINVGRLVHKNAYLYVVSTDKYPVSGLDIAKNRRTIEKLVKEGILETFRKKIPVDKIIKAYLEPTEEEVVLVKTEEEYVYPAPEGDAASSASAASADVTPNGVTPNGVETAGEVVEVPLETTPDPVFEPVTETPAPLLAVAPEITTVDAVMEETPNDNVDNGNYLNAIRKARADSDGDLSQLNILGETMNIRDTPINLTINDLYDESI